MHWQISQTINSYSPQERLKAIRSAILKDRGLTTKTAIADFLHPPSPLALTLKQVGLDPQAIKTTCQRLKLAIKNKQPIIIYGDYDADGVTATAILWETLNALGAKAYPFIPSRQAHGYGLSVKGLTDALAQSDSLSQTTSPLIITVDNGITAHAAAQALKERGLDLIITDHHQLSDTLPTAYAICHTPLLSGAGIAWILAKELIKSSPEVKVVHTSGVDNLAIQTLDLAAIGTIADLMPVVGVNRSIIKFGLEALTHTHRLGLLAVFEEAGILGQAITPYHVGFVVAPRLNAMGRLEHALDSLRLLLTTNLERAKNLAQLLGETNKTRQDLTQQYIDQALNLVGETSERILIVDHEEFHEGVIGLVAGKLAETYYRPAIVISRKELISKASVRSVSGVNIIKLIREFSSELVSVGGHPMAAGFTIKTQNIDNFRFKLTEYAQTAIPKEALIPSLKIDCQVELTDLNQSLFNDLETLKPFGIGNPKPVFAVDHVQVKDARTVGVDGRHLKLLVSDPTGYTLPAIGFNLGNLVLPGSVSSPEVKEVLSSGVERRVDLAATLDQNTWNGKTTLQLQLKDIAL